MTTDSILRKPCSDRYIRTRNLSVFLAAACVISMIAAAPQAQAQSTELRDARRLFEKQWRKIGRDYGKEHKTALVKYGEDLKKVLNYMKKRNDDFGTRPTETELKRFEEEQSVPTNITQGTPKLITQARDRYMSNTKPMRAKKKAREGTLLDGYFSRLASLEGTFEAASKSKDAAAVRAEVERARSTFGGGTGKKPGDDFSAITAIPTLKGKYMIKLALVYAMKARSNYRMRDLSGNGKHGRLIGASVDEEEPDALSFLKFHEILEMEKPIPLGEKWTMVIDAKFPLGAEDTTRVLITGAFRKDHVLVSNTGMLGVGVNIFKSCGFNVNDLDGWHRITVVGIEGKTAFFIDGEQVGTARAACMQPVTAIGNSPGYGQPWSGAVKAVAIWNRLLTAAEINKIPKSMVK